MCALLCCLEENSLTACTARQWVVHGYWSTALPRALPPADEEEAAAGSGASDAEEEEGGAWDASMGSPGGSPGTAELLAADTQRILRGALGGGLARREAWALNAQASGCCSCRWLLLWHAL